MENYSKFAILLFSQCQPIFAVFVHSHFIYKIKAVFIIIHPFIFRCLSMKFLSCHHKVLSFMFCWRGFTSHIIRISVSLLILNQKSCHFDWILTIVDVFGPRDWIWSFGITLYGSVGLIMFFIFSFSPQSILFEINLDWNFFVRFLLFWLITFLEQTALCKKSLRTVNLCWSSWSKVKM